MGGRVSYERRRLMHHRQAELSVVKGCRTGERTPEDLQRISEANIKHGRQTMDKLAAQRHAAEVGRRVVGGRKRYDSQLLDARLSLMIRTSQMG